MSLPTRRLGHSGVEVTSVALGAMMFGRWGNTDVDECHRMVDRALDAGITLFDTADMYDDGASEAILGEALRGRRDQVVLATKVGNPMGDDPQRSGLSRRWIMQACDDSLRRLQVDHIDLYQMHRPDPATPIDESLSALDELVTAGKVGAIGTSTFSAAQIDERQPARRRPRRHASDERAAAVLSAGPRDRARGAAGVPPSRPRRHRVGAAERRVADRQVPGRRRRHRRRARCASPITSTTATRRSASRSTHWSTS